MQRRIQKGIIILYISPTEEEKDMFNYFIAVHFTTQCRILLSFFRPLSSPHSMWNSQHTGTEVLLLCVIFFNFIPARSPFRLQPLSQHFVLTWEFPTLVTPTRGMLI